MHDDNSVAVLDHGYVKQITSWGSDEAIIEAVRMSTDKGFIGWEDRWECKSCGCLWRDNQDSTVSLFNAQQRSCNECELKPTPDACKLTSDARLLRYLYKHNHATPFEMAGFIIEVQAPIFVFREWHRHRTQSYNELSARYVALPDMFYVPSVERMMNAAQAKDNKQSSGTGLSEFQAHSAIAMIEAHHRNARYVYETLLSNGVAREVARVVIPVAQYSRMRASANLRNWLAFLTLRTDVAAQWEIRQYANIVADIVRETFPRTYALYAEGKKA